MSTLPLSYLSQRQSPVYVQVLGEFKLLVHGADHTHYLKYDKAKLLLALLASNKQPMSRTLLAEMLWPDSDLDKGRTRVRHALHLLRQALGVYADEILIATHTGISLRSDLIFVDLFDFLTPVEMLSIKKIKQKLDLYSLGFLPNIKIPPSDVFLNWHQSWHSRCELELAQHRHYLVSYYIESNDAQSALTYVKWWLCQTPDDEACHRYLIRLLLAAGDKEAALLAYQSCKDILQESFNILPSLETQALIQSFSCSHTPHSPLPKVSSESHYTLRPLATVAIAVTLKKEKEIDLSLHTATESDLHHLSLWQENLYHFCIAYGGWVSQNKDTTLLVHFGYPSVTERPIEQALGLVQELRQLNPAPGLQIQQAMHACLVSVHETNTSRLDAVTAPSILPLVWRAQHGEVLLSPQAAARLTESVIEVVQIGGEAIFKLGAGSLAQRLITTRIFGRMQYFDSLIQQWARYIPSQPPAFIMLNAQAGLGKTQLALAVADYVNNVEGRVLFLSNQEGKSAEPYHAITNWLLTNLDGTHQPFELNRDSIKTQVLQKQLAKKYGLSLSTSKLFFESLIFNPIETEEQHQTFLDGFLDFLSEYKGGRQPLCIIWDNLQWVDEYSLKLLEGLSKSRTKKVAFILGLSRYEISGFPWPTMQLNLTPLTAATVAEYLNQRSKVKKISREVKQFILNAKIDNPRYINDILHLAQLKLSYNELPRITDYVAAKLHILPATTQQIIFLRALLPCLSKETACNILGVPPHSFDEEFDGYFNFAFMTLAILRLIPETLKKELCNRVASFFIETKQDSASIAHYLALAKSPETIHWWQKAIREALEVGAAERAIDYIYQSLVSQEYVVDVAERDKYTFENHAILANIAIATKGPAAVTVIDAYHNAAKNSQHEDLLQSCAIFWGQWVAQHGLGNFSASLLAAQRLQQVAERAKSEIWLGWAYYAQAQYYLWRGLPERSEPLLLQAITTINLATEPELGAGFMGSGSYALAYSALGLAQTLLGHYSPAHQNTNHAVQLAEQSKDPVCIVMCKLHLLRVHYLTNNLRVLDKASKELVQLMSAGDQTNVWYNLALSYKILVAHLKAPNSESLAQIEQTRDSIEKNMPVALDGYLCTLARCYLASNKLERALAVLEEAKTLGELRQSLLLRPEIHCLQGDVFLALGHAERAHSEWGKASDIAQEQQLMVYFDWVTDRLPPVA